MTSWGRFVCALILSLMGLIVSTPLLAQYDSAQISGSVHDTSGALITNATVHIQNRDTGLVARNHHQLRRHFLLKSHIPPGVYTVIASSQGSQPRHARVCGTRV